MATLPIVGTLDNGYRMTNGAPPLIGYFLEANSQTFVRGDLVYLATSRLTVCGTDPGTVLGVALEDATNVTSGHKYIQTLIINSFTELALQVYHATAASATFATDIAKGVAYDVTAYAAGKWMIDIAGSGDVNVTVTDYMDPLGDIYMRCYCRFTPAHLQMP